MKMNRPLPEANSGAGDRSGEGRLWECPKGRDSGNSENAERSRTDVAQRSQNRELMDKNRIEGRHGAMSWHNTATAKAAKAASE